MKIKQLLVLTILLITCPVLLFAQEETPKRNCKTRKEIRNTHRLEYRSPNGTYRGCQVKAEYYFQVKKTNRGSPRKNIEICEEGDMRFTPRIGSSYEICR